MRFYAGTYYGEYLLFSTKDICLAIYTAWNYNADLWVVPTGTKKSDVLNPYRWVELDAKLIFSGTDPLCGGLEEYGLEVVDDEQFSSMYIRNIKTGKKYLWEDYEDKLRVFKEKGD